MRRAVVLDRDGVLTEAIVRGGKPFASTTIVAEAAPALATLRAAGFLLVVATNQPDVARGTVRRQDVETFHRAMQAELRLDGVYTCYHDDEDHCPCRKPKPGMLFDAARDHDLDLSRSFMVGDRWRDVDAGRAAGCRTIFIDRGYTERQPSEFDARVTTLTQASSWILSAST